jgi:hypothetical protein
MTEYWEKWGKGRPSKEKLEKRKKHHQEMERLIRDTNQFPMLKHILYGNSTTQEVVRDGKNILVTWRQRHD